MRVATNRSRALLSYHHPFLLEASLWELTVPHQLVVAPTRSRFPRCRLPTRLYVQVFPLTLRFFTLVFAICPHPYGFSFSLTLFFQQVNVVLRAKGIFCGTFLICQYNVLLICLPSFLLEASLCFLCPSWFTLSKTCSGGATSFVILSLKFSSSLAARPRTEEILSLRSICPDRVLKP